MILKVEPVGCQSLGKKLTALWFAAVLLWLPLRVGLYGLWASAFLGWLRCIPLQLVMVAVAVKKSVAQRLKWYLSFVKVSVVEVAGLGHDILLPCFECC